MEDFTKYMWYGAAGFAGIGGVAAAALIGWKTFMKAGGFIGTAISKGGNAIKGRVDSRNAKKKEERQLARRARVANGGVSGRLTNLASGGSIGRGLNKDMRNKILEGQIGEGSAARVSRSAQRRFLGAATRRQLAGGSKWIPGSASQKGLNAAQSSALAIQEELHNKATGDVQNAMARDTKLSAEDLVRIAEGNSARGFNGSNRATQAAAMRQVLRTHDMKGMKQLIDNKKLSSTAKQDLADALQGESNRPGWLGQGAIAEIRAGKHGSFDQLALKGMEKMSEESIAKADQKDLEELVRISNDNPDAPAVKELRERAGRALDTHDTRVEIKDNVEGVHALAGREYANRADFDLAA